LLIDAAKNTDKMTLEEVIVAGQLAFIQMTGGLDFVLLDKLAIDMIDLKRKNTHSYAYSYVNLMPLNLRKN